jgi:hypothetical protein
MPKLEINTLTVGGGYIKCIEVTVDAKTRHFKFGGIDFGTFWTVSAPTNVPRLVDTILS